MRLRATLAAFVLGVGAALFASPGRFPAQVRYLAGHTLDTPDPITTASVDTAALRRAAAILPPGSVYTIEVPAQPLQLGADVRGVAHLFLLPSLEAADPAEARWVLRYGLPRRLPPGTRAVRSFSIGQDVALVEIART
jgi:hypothetical protein